MSIIQRAVALVVPRGWWRDLRDPLGPGVRFALCRTCHLRHPLVAPDIDARFAEFARRHEGHDLEIVEVRTPALYGELLAGAPNADVKMAFQGAQSMTVTNLHALANSATAGWQSDAVTNTSSLYLDYLFQVTIAAVNTAPANSKGLYALAGHSLDGGTTYTRPFGAAEAARTYDDVTTLPQCAPRLGFIPYATQNTALYSEAMSMAATCGFVLPERFLVGLINHTGMTLAASGNLVKYNGVWRTVV